MTINEDVNEEVGEEVYESRFGWSARTVGVLLTCLLFVTVLLLADVFGTGPLGAVLRICGLLLFGGGALVMAYICGSRKVALRVDADGILLGGTPLRYAATTTLVPWSEVRGLRLWLQPLPYGSSMPYVGVHRVPGAARLPGTPTGPLGRSAVEDLTGVDAELVSASRAVNGWPLDTDTLLATVGRYAPGAVITVAPGFPSRR
ncbi:hypothetical protein AB0D08_12710 [Kitasatospora sp. NPDC048540]|uniref:hypothetical protein n=1 Tax=Kitasatospora sp. NPDC048540 TaxID=3155634 RepID=UPI0033C90CFA